MISSPAISSITLGTVQLGLPYGVANKQGQPSVQYSHELLHAAMANGIYTLDTARTYGNSEDVIGSFNRAKDFTIVSKFKLSDEAFNNPLLALQEARQSIMASLEKLHVPLLPICMVHTRIDQDIDKLTRLLSDLFEKLKDEGLISEGGISLETPNPINDIRSWKNINHVQVPMNLFDSRLLQNERMHTLMDNNVIVFIRSIYLQGLMLMKENELPPHLLSAKPYLQKINSIAVQVNKSVKELAFSFARDTPGVGSIIIGADTIEQLEENAGLMKTPKLEEEARKEIIESFRNIEERIITPALWNK